jgi:hypothetical protein
MARAKLDLGEVKGAVAYATTARVYHVRWGMTWAIAIVHDATGCLSLVTDYGNWSMRWNAWGMPRRADGRRATLHEFLADAGTDYVLSKVMDLKQRERVSRKKTIEYMKERILERRRGGGCSREAARDAWNALEDYDPTSPDQDEAYPPSEVQAVVSDAWECFMHAPTTDALAFREMWPELRKLIAATVGETPT